MTSVENDDEFDWEAAVKEIDVACSNANPRNSHFAPSNLNPDFDGSLPPFIKRTDNFNPGKRKQSTIDKFVSKLGQETRAEDPGVRRGEVEVVESGEKGSFVDIDPVAAKTWIYPVNIPLRQYQLAITKTSLFSNTLVALPTGLGKTLIAAVVMYNYFRWFPEGKIVFAAPSRPLVLQQIEACHNIVGIPQEWTIDMTGQISPTRRACFWKTKRIFFVTPQVLEKDIQAGTCPVRYLVCLVIDEAHRALGNYSYCVAVRELMVAAVQLRILALTATPGSKQPAIQHIIDNLQISTLEYRNESDSDVSPYVHNRKMELIEVSLGHDALDVNKQLLEVIRPFVARLSSLGLLQNRDYHNLSPPDLLNSRDNFRRAPPPSLPQNKYGEVEAYFGGLITLYHIRKLLSSHGIRPAYEMLEEKLKQGSFARLMGKNEAIRKIKLSMRKSLDHGAPSPKLSKMLEVLVDHFKTKDPQSSRVIIFSNFRGSVRDIMDALADIGDLVKATEFIGQSSGKQLKGQSQKVQQAVLQKFRAGGYNVIVATSIGEEGLDIMEVDLVICFDANISPLRMIQRMGRTGRKHDGRVVVLACEGAELKGYMRKQASSRTIRKHMHNGGINSFSFHPSPRMVPHIFKPEVQFVELTIEQYVPRGKKVKDDNAIQAHAFKEKLTSAEITLIAKYFQPTGERTWKPSLIAFPHFQEFPSRVSRVMHSTRTDMLIDAMQQLQGISFSGDSRSFTVEYEGFPHKNSRVDFVPKEDNYKEDCVVLADSQRSDALIMANKSELAPEKTRKQITCNLNGDGLPSHTYLSSDFVCVDAQGMVQISYVPSFPLKHSNFVCDGNSLLPNQVEQNACDKKPSVQSCKDLVKQGRVNDLPDNQTACRTNVAFERPRISSCDARVEELDQCETTLGNLKTNMCTRDSPDFFHAKATTLHADEHNQFKDNEMSPRLTNMLQSGIVPESPIDQVGLCNLDFAGECDGNVRNASPVPDIGSISKCITEMLPMSPSRKLEISVQPSTSYDRNILRPTNTKLYGPLVMVGDVAGADGCAFVSPVAKETSCTGKNSCDDWLLKSVDNFKNFDQVRKFKRLRKVGEIEKTKITKSNEKSSLPVVNLNKCFSGAAPRESKNGKGNKKCDNGVHGFIEVEAEVSSENEVSSDEEYEDDSAYDGSFIDDRINPSAASTQAESSGVDMLAVYRRSLLSQSPMIRESDSAQVTPESGSVMSRTNDSGTSSIKTTYSPHAFQVDAPNQWAVKSSDAFRNNLETTPTSTIVKNSKLDTRKRKSSFVQSTSVPAINLISKFSCNSETVANESIQQGYIESFDANADPFSDDQFFASVDLDAVEEQAALLIQHKSQFSVQKQEVVTKSNLQNFDLQNSPSFDLGIC